MSELSASNPSPPMATPRRKSRVVLVGLLGIGLLAGAWYARQKLLNRPPTPEQLIAQSKMGSAVMSEVDTLQKQIQANPDDVAARIELVKLYQKLSLPDLGSEQLREIIARKPEELSYRITLGNALLAMEKYDEASRVYMDAAQKFPKEDAVYQGLSATLYAQKRYMEAMQAAKQAIKIAPDDPNNHFALGAAAFEYAMQFPDPEIHSDELILAKNELEPLTKVWKDNGDLLFRLGRIYVELRVRKQAMANLEKAYKLLPERGDVAFELARTYNLASKPEDALRISEEAIGNGADHFLLYELAGSLYLQRGTAENLQKAVEMYTKALEKQPKSPRTLDKLGVALLRLNKIDEARKAFEQSLIINPNRAYPYQQMATIYTRMRLPDRAKIAADMARKMTANEQQLKQLQELSKLHADDINLRLILADRYRDLKLNSAAKDEYFYVLRLDRQNARALAGLKALGADAEMPLSPIPSTGMPSTGGAQ
jgi:tetratricopeptide (TPR) repeat protein